MKDLYYYGGRTFASIAAARGYHAMREWFATGTPNRNNFKLQERGRSLTQTKTKKKKMGEFNDFSVHQSFSKISTGNKKLKRVVRGNITYRDEFEETLNWVSNQEYVIIPWYLGTQSQFLNSTDNLVTNRDAVSYASWFDLNPTQGVAVGKLTDADDQPNNDWIGASNATVYMDFINRGNVSCYLKIHYFVAKQDTSTTVVENYFDQAAQSAMYKTNWIAAGTGSIPSQSGNEVVAYAAATSTSSAVLTALPYTNLMSKRLVKSTWRKLKTKSVVFAPGDTHRHTTICNLQQFGIRERMASNPVDYPKGTICCVLEVQGTAVKLAATPANTYSGGELGVVVTRKVHISPLQAPNKRFQTTYVGQGTVTGGNGLAAVETFAEGIIQTAGAVL